LGGRVGHHHLHRRPGFDQGATQLSGLVAGDAAGQAEHEVLAGQRLGRIRHLHGETVTDAEQLLAGLFAMVSSS
jgi:hypothetical protein